MRPSTEEDLFLKQLELTPRLALLASWVPEGARLADIGTDHAYLPVWLMLAGRLRSAIASDLARPGPPGPGPRHGQDLGVAERIDFRLGPGWIRARRRRHGGHRGHGRRDHCRQFWPRLPGRRTGGTVCCSSP